MKMTPAFKRLFMSSVIGLYVSGIAYVIFDYFVRDGSEFNAPSPWQFTILHLHGIVGLLFFILFGYLYATHIMPGLRRRRRQRSGIILLVAVLALCFSVPGLYYLSNESLKNFLAAFHTYLGLIALAPFVFHMWNKQIG